MGWVHQCERGRDGSGRLAWGRVKWVGDGLGDQLKGGYNGSRDQHVGGCDGLGRQHVGGCDGLRGPARERMGWVRSSLAPPIHVGACSGPALLPCPPPLLPPPSPPSCPSPLPPPPCHSQNCAALEVAQLRRNRTRQRIGVEITAGPPKQGGRGGVSTVGEVLHSMPERPCLPPSVCVHCTLARMAG